MDIIQAALRSLVQGKRMNLINGCPILTDRPDYRAIDQVFPLFGEQQFFLDEIRRDKMRGAEALEIGAGSGVLSIGAARAGAKRVTALEINSRAKNFAGFNFVLNGVEDIVTVLDGQAEIWRPVAGRRFDYIFSNPPFEPTPPGMDYFYHSSAGPYGLDFMDKIFVGLDEHLAERGCAQIVTAAPGNHESPTMLLDLIRARLSGSTTVLVHPDAMTFDAVMDRLGDKNMGRREAVEALRQMAQRDGVTHLHLCMIHYEPGPQRLRVEPSKRLYADYWDRLATELP